MEITIVIDIGKKKGLTVTIDEIKMIEDRKLGEEEIKEAIRTTAKHMVETIMDGMEYVPK